MASPGSDVLEEPAFHVILTDRLRLRTLRVTDAEAMMPILSRKEVMDWTVFLQMCIVTKMTVPDSRTDTRPGLEHFSGRAVVER